MNQSQDEHSFVRTIDASWPSTPTTQPQYRFTQEPGQYSTPYVNGVTPRPVAPAVIYPPTKEGPSVTNIWVDAKST